MRNFSNRRPGRRDSKPSFRDSGRFNRDSERGEFRKPKFEMHAATCGKCGARCEVPFRPSGSKPVYCNSCFRKGENFKSDAPDKKEFNIINEKLDRILEALGKD